ncbi:MAG TPA: DUF3090 family protein [Chloroflexia bacterium]|nr:DUF3090 family protein [Chloroflexia bacterium]
MSMRRPRHNMGRVEWIGAEAIGLPGQRTFRILVASEGNSAQLWLEKQQVQALAEAIARMLLEIDTERGTELRASAPAAHNPKPPGFPTDPAIDLHIGTLGLRYDPQRDLIALEAFDVDSSDSEPPAFRCLATRKQMEALQANSLEAVAGGRPKCPFCGTPLSSAGLPHFCPPTNGHQKLTPDEE